MTVQSTTHLPDGTEAPDDPPATGPLAHPCPRCNAQPGHHCTTRTGNPITETFHKARITGNPQDSRPHRPITLTPDLTNTICQHIRNGTTLTTAAQATGIGTTTLHRWIMLADSDAEEHQMFREFRDAVMRARAEGQAELAAKIIEAGNRKVKSIDPVIDPVKGGQAKGDDGEPLFKITYESDWKAHAFVLERSYPAEWGKRQTLEIDHRDQAEQVLASTGMQAAVDVAARRFADALRERREQRALEAAARAEQVIEGQVESG